MDQLPESNTEENDSSMEHPALKWMEQRIERGEISESSGRGRAVALRAMISILGKDESIATESLLENLDHIAKRWAIKHGAKPDTVATYQSRAKSLLVDHERYLADPKTFRFNLRDRTPTPKKVVAKKPEPDVNQTPMPPPVTETKHPDRDRHVVRLEGGRDFVVEMPRDLKMAELRKAMWVMLGHCVDFDPANNDFSQTGIVPRDRD